MPPMESCSQSKPYLAEGIGNSTTSFASFSSHSSFHTSILCIIDGNISGIVQENQDSTHKQRFVYSAKAKGSPPMLLYFCCTPTNWATYLTCCFSVAIGIGVQKCLLYVRYRPIQCLLLLISSGLCYWYIVHVCAWPSIASYCCLLPSTWISSMYTQV